MKKIFILGTFLLSLIGTSATAFAIPTVAVDFTGGISSVLGDLGLPPQTVGATLGYSFSINKTIKVTHLGFYDGGLPGFDETHAVGIYTAGGGFLDSVTVNSGSTPDSSFRYEPLGLLLELAPGDYRIGGYITIDSVDSFFHTATNVTTAPGAGITFGTGVSNLGTELDFPGSTPGGNNFFGPNFKFEPVETIPTPGSLILIFSGLGFIGIRKKLQS